jgi:nitroreductase
MLAAVAASDLLVIDRLLGTTRSVRRRLDLERPVAPELIESCIDLAVQAPTGAQREAWRFLVVTQEAKKRGLGELYLGAFERYSALRLDEARASGGEPPPVRPALRHLAEHLHEFPVLIVVCSEGRPPADDVARQVAFYGSILPAAWSLMLALRSRGLGATWTTLHLAHEREAAALLGIPSDATQTVLLPVAWLRDAVLRPAARRPAHEVTYWDRWGDTRGGSS